MSFLDHKLGFYEDFFTLVKKTLRSKQPSIQDRKPLPASMKKAILILLFFSLSAYSQSIAEVKKNLMEKFTHKNGDTIQLPDWSFLNDSIENFNLPFISTKLKSKKFFKTKFSFLDDLHSAFDDCILMFDHETKDLIIHLPIWYSGMNKEFYKQFIGISLPNEDEKKQFAKELGAILLFYNKQSKIENIAVDKKLAEIIISSPKEDYPNIVQIFFEKHKIIEIKRLTGKYQNMADKINKYSP